MAGDEMVNGMSNGKNMGGGGRSQRQSVRGKAQQSVARASRDVIDLGKSGGVSPPQKHPPLKRSAKCRIKVIAVSCTEAKDTLRRLEKIAALLLTKIGGEV